MKNILKTFGLLLLSGTAFVACDDYLDRQPDEQLTAAQIFQKAKTTEQYLTNVYGYQSNYSDPSGQILPWSCCDDDGSIVFTGRNYSLINYDTWNPDNNIYRSQTYNNLYKGIREANYFMQHVFECPEMSEIDKGYHYNEARFLRAYYYSLLMSAYGPVFLIGDDPVDFTQEGLNERERNTWEECINYVANELWETSKGLPDVWTGETANYGRATKGAALAIRSRMLLYSARKLFNGNDLYKGVIDKYGNPLFPTVYDEKKWETAAQAAKDVIDMGIYGLVGADGTDPYTSMHDLYTKVGPVNGVTERIFTYLVNAYNWGVATTPRAARTRAYGSYGPTLRHGQRPLSHHGIYERRPGSADHRSRIGIQRDGILDLHASDLRRRVEKHLHDVSEPRTALLHQRLLERHDMAQRQREENRHAVLQRRKFGLRSHATELHSDGILGPQVHRLHARYSHQRR